MASRTNRLARPRVVTPPAFDFLHTPPLGAVRYRVAYGGRGSAKSWQFARALLVHGMRQPLRILCAREYQSSIRDSVHRLLSDQIDRLGFSGFYTINESSIVGANGTDFLFKGLRRDIAGIKSTEGIDLCWIEEAEAVTDHSWQTLIPTIRKRCSEIWVSFNPALPSDATYVRFVTKPPKGENVAIIRKVTWRDNPFVRDNPDDVLHRERLALFETDPEAHAHVWEGEPWQRSDAQVLAGKWRVMEFEPDASFGEPLYGGDWGFANDPTVITRLYVKDRRLYVYRAEGKPQLDNDQTAQLFRSVLDDEKRVVRADSARPETINEMRKRGLNVVGVEKWPGSVADGIAHLRSYEEIIIHPTNCKRAVQEARLWRYKMDPRTQEILPHLQDGNEHTWDAARYALAPLIKRGRTVRFVTAGQRQTAS